ncbi:hypothetical protein [Methanosarcina horonobensis]|uniref:hypothetical protein n=1 Tax=Methanosarcina horonobensis TaxID=418008 RepID=UPI000A66F156|nr:hypothetical protein [Methanosarcina horonobensis]
MVKKKMWEKLCSRECLELKEAAGDMIIAPSDPEVKLALVQKILKSFEKYPALEKEISSFIENGQIKKIAVEESSNMITAQNSDDKIRVLEEFNELLEKLIATNSDVGFISDIRDFNSVNSDNAVRNSELSECRQGNEKILEKKPLTLPARSSTET